MKTKYAVLITVLALTQSCGNETIPSNKTEEIKEKPNKVKTIADKYPIDSWYKLERTFGDVSFSVKLPLEPELINDKNFDYIDYENHELVIDKKYYFYVSAGKLKKLKSSLLQSQIDLGEESIDLHLKVEILMKVEAIGFIEKELVEWKDISKFGAIGKLARYKSTSLEMEAVVGIFVKDNLKYNFSFFSLNAPFSEELADEFVNSFTILN